ncbi:helix-turn-helix domain-containing protein [Streptomyces sp. SD15]
MRGWTDAEVAAHATVGRARSGRCVPSAETVRALAAVVGVDPARAAPASHGGDLTAVRAPTDTPRVTRTVIVESLGESLDALRHRRRTPVPYRVLARRVGM